MNNAGICKITKFYIFLENYFYISSGKVIFVKSSHFLHSNKSVICCSWSGSEGGMNPFLLLRMVFGITLPSLKSVLLFLLLLFCFLSLFLILLALSTYFRSLTNSNNHIFIIDDIFLRKYQPSGAEGTRSPPARPHRLQHLTARLIQHSRRGMEIG